MRENEKKLKDVEQHSIELYQLRNLGDEQLRGIRLEGLHPANLPLTLFGETHKICRARTTTSGTKVIERMGMYQGESYSYTDVKVEKGCSIKKPFPYAVAGTEVSEFELFTPKLLSDDKTIKSLIAIAGDPGPINPSMIDPKHPERYKTTVLFFNLAKHEVYIVLPWWTRNNEKAYGGAAKVVLGDKSFPVTQGCSGNFVAFRLARRYFLGAFQPCCACDSGSYMGFYELGKGQLKDHSKHWTPIY